MGASRFSPGTVLGGLALVIAVSGIGIAAIPSSGDGTISGCYAKKSGELRVVDTDKKGKKSKCVKGEKRLAWNQQGPQGLQGPKGDPGTTNAAGLPGEPGEEGAPGPGMLPISTNINTNATRFGSLAGTSAINEATVQTPIPPGAPLTIRDISASITAPVAAGESGVFSIRVNGATAISCTINPGERTCTGAGTVTVNPGDLVNTMTVSSAAGPNATASIITRVTF